jgi:hypothetical protein
MAEPGETAGQVASPDSTGTTGAAPQGDKGQSANPSQTTTTGPDSGQAESFFDPKSIEDKPELLSAYKQMQAKFTKSNQKFKDAKNKVDAYDAFLKDPQGTLEQIARQYGYNLVQGKPGAQDDANPKTWDDVYSRAKQEVLKELGPFIGEIRQIKQQNVEQYLDGKYPDWKTYEDDMLELLQKHPTLSSNPDKLYQLSVPDEVWEARAIKAAKAKLEGSEEQISGPSAISRQTSTDVTGIKTFNDAVAAAKAKLAKEGIRPLTS